MKKITKSQVKSIVRRQGYLKVWICPSNMYPMPNHPFNIAMQERLYSTKNKEVVCGEYGNTLEDLLVSYAFYNCSSETGNRIHFYIENEIGGE